MNMSKQMAVIRESKGLLDALHRLGGYYVCPKDADGRRLGPLVGYAGKDEKGRQKVGDIYANFAKMEEYPRILAHYAPMLLSRIDPEFLDSVDVFCGMPMGGVKLSGLLALDSWKQDMYLEKRVLVAETPTTREVSQLTFGRHEVQEGARVVLVEDVVNNFSTTGAAIDLFKFAGAEVIGILCLLNRSDRTSYGLDLSVVSIVWQPMPQYAQDDPAVADDITRGNLVAKPKRENDWARLQAIMREHNVQP